MQFETHTELEGRHAFLSPSSYHWINYDDEKLDNRYLTRLAAARGTELHKFAHDAIRLGIRQKENNQTLNRYINDSIRWKMQTEVPLFYSWNAFGCVDAISFRKAVLRISDLKNGVTEASFTQLECYSALFCLEYDVKPMEISTELRIYQNDAVKEVLADPDRITHIMDRYVTFDRRIEELRREVL